MTRRWLLAAIPIWVATSCVVQPPPRPPVAPDLAACDAACDHLRALGCPAGAPTPNGVTCTQVCFETERTGWESWGAACVREARSCDDANRCH